MSLPINHHLRDQADAYRRHVHRQLLYLVEALRQLSGIMVEETRSMRSTGQVRWTENETDKLVDYLYEHRSERTDGGHWKQSTYTAAVTYLQQFHVAGKAKDVNSLRYKWGQVSTLLYYLFPSS